MSKRVGRKIAGYAMAAVSVTAAVVITKFATAQLIGDTPLFFAAVAISAWFGGTGPGLVATLLAGIATTYFFFGIPHTLAIEADDVVRVSVFIAVSVLISSM